LKTFLRNSLITVFFSGVLAMGWTSVPVISTADRYSDLLQRVQSSTGDSLNADTTGVLMYPFEDRKEFDYSDGKGESGLFLKPPTNIKTEVVYDPVTGQYVVTEKVGDMTYRLPKAMSLEEYVRYDMQNSIRNYWRQKAGESSLESRGGLIPRLSIGGEAFNRIFGGNNVDIRTQGFVEVSFGYQMNETQNPSIQERLRKVPTFNFDQKIQMSVNGSIGDKMRMRVNYNTEATFDYENKMNLEYSGDEDEIIKKIEAGNVSLPLNGTLITGATNLFGVKTDMQFGKLSLSTVFSQSKGETKVVNIEDGAQTTPFEIKASDYDANRHFFLSQYFQNTYDEALKNLPIVNSAITINRIEVWVTNKSGDYSEARNILALMDLGEHSSNIYNGVPLFGENGGQPYPDNIYPFNDANRMYGELSQNYVDIRDVSSITKTLSAFTSYGFQGGQDFEKIEQARKLSTSEYTLNPQLGYISLNSALNSDEVLAVAYNYTAKGKTYQVGEFSTDGVNAPSTLMVKLLKGTNQTPKLPTWKLMMKNIYNLNAYSLTAEDFRLNVLYENEKTGTLINYLPESNLQGKILLNVLNLDNLNSQLDQGSDGSFDFIDRITVQSSSGRIIFPSVEPFGKYLSNQISDNSFREKYAYQSLYDSIRTYAVQDAEHNKFVLKGSYSGSSNSEIALGTINLTQGSVTVTAGGITLQEGLDYTVDYTLGRVKIINPAYLESGTSLQVSTESEDLFSVQQKTLLGTHANYAFSDNFNLGATILHLKERPLTQKVLYGEEPVSNTMLGLDLSYNTESQFLTRMVDKLPFIDTKETSTIAVEAEVAKLMVGNSNVTQGAVYIDDFESTKTSLDLKTRSAWMLASTPQNQQSLFPEGNLNDDLAYGYNRARVAWYNIDPLFLRNTAQTPSHIKQNRDLQSNHLVREVYQEEIYPEKDTEIGTPTNLSVLNLAFYPEERGPYNYESGPSSVSSGLNPEGTLANPESRWGGIMRKITTTDFESANIEYIEFWMMDPFVNDESGTMTGGDLYFNLGEVSEDLLKDSRKGFENGLPETDLVTEVDTTVWGRVATKTQLTKSFVSDDNIIYKQDIGFDGLSSTDEQNFFADYLNQVKPILSTDAYQSFSQDPSGDDYHYYRGSDYDQAELGILDRYKLYNGPEGNSVPAGLSPESYTTSATTLPDVEDVNTDNTLNEYERYYQYRVSLRPENMKVGENFISDERTASVTLANGKVSSVKWYQFKVPVRTPESIVGSIADFSSIRFIRMFLRNFEQPVVLRFATLDLVRADWRIYTEDLEENSNNLGTNTRFEVSAVNIEENSDRTPVNYVLPPKIDRVIDPANAQLLQLNEQSMTMKVMDLEQGDARAAYKGISLDFRPYKSFKMEVHAEAIEGSSLRDEDLSFFVRIGSDYNDNYYEYELPLKLTAPGVYNNALEADRYLVWPDENRIDIPLDVFTNIKLKRNEQMRAAGSTVQINDVFEWQHPGYNDDKNIVKIKGSPNLGNVAVMMMGIRNKSGELTSPAKSVEVWVNEMRLMDLTNSGGWASNARVSTKLADLGTVVFAGSYRSNGFGSIDKSASERSNEELFQYDISSNFDLGRFFPKQANVRIPLYVGVSKVISNPEYNPLDPDITMKQTMNSLTSKAERDSVKRLVQDYSKRTSIVLNNVKVDKTSKSGTPRLYDPTNFSASFAFNKQKDRDINTQYSLEKSYRMALNYNFNSRPKLYEPFKKVKFMKGDALRLVRDFNFYLLPTQISYRNELYRYYFETQSRNIADKDVIVPLTVEKDFLWRRNFDLKYNLTRSLKIDFSSEGTARIDEPEGRINRADDDYQLKKDSILRNLFDLGRPILYHHSLNATYQVPLNKIPLFNWVTATGRYQALYDWTAGSLTNEDVELGNVIENSRIIQGSGQLSMTNLYNKIKFLKDVNQKFGASTRFARSSRSRVTAANEQKKGENFRIKEVSYRANKVAIPQREAAVIEHNLKTTDVQVKVYNEEGQQVRGAVKVLDENKLSFQSNTAIEKARVEVTGKRKIENSIFYTASQYAARTAMMLKNVSVTYTSSEGTYLPGFMPEPSIFGSGHYTPDAATFGQVASTNAPGIPFLLGWQDDDFARSAAMKGWITKDTTLNNAYLMTSNKAWTFRANVEPIPFLTIDVTGSHSLSENMSEYYLYDGAKNAFIPSNRTINGSFSMSINTLSTAFSKMGEADVEPPTAFQNMLDYRYTIATRLSARRVANTSENYEPEINDPETGYPIGYGPTSQEVLIPSFIAAYTGQSPERVSLDPFPSLKYMRPNWRVTYNGVVSKIEGLNKVMKSMSLSQTYRSTYNVGSYITNLNYDDQVYDDGWSYIVNSANNFIPQFDINSVNITELFNPLVNVDVTWLNDVSTTFQINKARNLTLNFANVQLTEVRSNEVAVGLGYRFPRMDLIIKSKRGQKAYSNDLNINVALAFAKNKTVLRKLTEAENQLTAGQKKVTIKTTADYMLSDRFQLRLYYDKVINNPFTSSSFPTKSTNFGVSFRFTLAQ